MKTLFYFLISISICFSCERNDVAAKPTYNEKANELLKQVISENHCECILEIPDESMIKVSLQETPLKSKNIKQKLIQKLGLKNQMELDSLDKSSNDFILDKNFVEKNKIKVISRKAFVDSGFLKLSENCPHGIFSFKKPIFDSQYKMAALDFYPVYSCLSDITIYKKENSKWVQK